MAKRKTRNNDIRRRLSDTPYSVDYFARKHDISPKKARKLMRKVGRNRDKLNDGCCKDLSEVGCSDGNL